MVHGEGEMGVLKMLGDLGRKNGFLAYPDSDVEARWPAVHLNHAAVLFRLVLENGERSDAVYHGVAEEGVGVRALMETMGKGIGLSAERKSGEEIAGVLGFFGGNAGVANVVSSQRTRKELSWTAERDGLLKDAWEDYFR